MELTFSVYMYIFGTNMQCLVNEMVLALPTIVPSQFTV